MGAVKTLIVSLLGWRWNNINVCVVIVTGRLSTKFLGDEGKVIAEHAPNAKLVLIANSLKHGSHCLAIIANITEDNAPD